MMGPFQLGFLLICISLRPSVGQSFDWQLLSQISKYGHDNVVLSPFSLRFVMFLLHEASDNASTTAKELTKTFYDTNIKEQTNIIANTINGKGEELSMGSKIYVRPNQKFSDQFSKTINIFQSDVENINFKDGRNAAEKINNWVASVTKGNIPHFVSESNIQDTGMMLISALYFKGNWKTPFDDEHTSSRNFHLQNGVKISTPFMLMYNKMPYAYSKELQAAALKLPYEGGHYIMTLLLPDESIGNLLQKLQSFNLNNLRFVEIDTSIAIPKFKFEYAVDLNNALQALGIREIFTNNANFKNIANNDDLKVSKVFQKSGITVDEKGSTAYGATGVQLIDKFGGVNTFNANRPFIFYIEDQTLRSKPIIFAGIVNNPSV